MKIFNQSLKEFFSSKSNLTGVASLAFGSWLISCGDIANGGMLVSWGLGLVGIKDAIVKSNKADK